MNYLRHLLLISVLLAGSLPLLQAQNTLVTRSLAVARQMRLTDYTNYHQQPTYRLLADYNPGTRTPQNAISYLGFPAEANVTANLVSATLKFEVVNTSTADFRVASLNTWPTFQNYEIVAQTGDANWLCLQVDIDLISLPETIQALISATNAQPVSFSPQTKDIQAIDVTPLMPAGGTAPVFAIFMTTKSTRSALHFQGMPLAGDNGIAPASLELQYSVPDENLTTSANMGGYKSYCDQNFARRVDAGTTAYIARTSPTDAGVIRLIPIADGLIPAGTPVILKTEQQNAAGNGYQLTLGAADSQAQPLDNNLLRVSDGVNRLTEVYRLAYTAAGGIGFYLYSDSSTSQPTPGIVYIEKESSNGNSLHFVIDDSESVTHLSPLAEDYANAPISSPDFNLSGATTQGRGLIIRNRQVIFVR